MRIENRVFVVTGAGSGIGRAVTLELLSRGAKVAAVDLAEVGLNETADLAGSGAARMSRHVLNVSDQAAVAALPDAVIAAHGQVDGLLSIAGIIQPFVNIVDLPLEVTQRVMSVNFWGTYYLDTAFLPVLLARPEASLLNVSSMGALVPVPGQGAYGASKAAVKLLTETLYAELQGTAVTVTLVIPGAVETNITVNSGVQMPDMKGAGDTKMTSAPDAARQIVDAVEKGHFRVVIGGDARMLDRLARIAPVKAITVIANKMKSLMG